MGLAPTEHPFSEQPVPALQGITGGLLPARCVRLCWVEEDLPLLVVWKQRGKVTATLEPQAGDRAAAAVVPLAQVAGLAASTGVWQRLVMLGTGQKGSTSASPGFAGWAGAVRGKGSPLGVGDCRCAHLS